MKIYFFLLLISLSPLTRSEVISTEVKEIDWGNHRQDSAMVLLSTGQVLWYSPEEKKLLTIIHDAHKNKSRLKIDLDSKKILSISQKNEKFLPLHVANGPLTYSPTILKDEEFLKQLFHEARRTTKPETQCFNRAHIWSYEWRINRNIYSSKVWLFFTRKFIRKYKFDWWFHVAPMVGIEKDGKINERILDIKYAKIPLRTKEWTDIFVRDNADCPVVTRYSDYADFPESGSCFLMKSSMYYYQPVDLEDLELSGIEKMKWVRGEVQEAYREAFDHIF